MAIKLVPISTICPCWKQSLAPAGVEALQRGIAAERERFRGKPFVVVETRYEFDYDGLTEYFELLDGFPTGPEAIAYAKQKADDARRAVLAEPSYASYHWKVIEAAVRTEFEVSAEHPSVRHEYHELFKVENGSGYDHRDYFIDVLHIATEEIIGTELFTYIGAESKMTRYLMNRGMARRPGAQPGG
jgi:hypothetical protein